MTFDVMTMRLVSAGRPLKSSRHRPITSSPFTDHTETETRIHFRFSASSAPLREIHDHHAGESSCPEFGTINRKAHPAKALVANAMWASSNADSKVCVEQQQPHNFESAIGNE